MILSIKHFYAIRKIGVAIAMLVGSAMQLMAQNTATANAPIAPYQAPARYTGDVSLILQHAPRVSGQQARAILSQNDDPSAWFIIVPERDSIPPVPMQNAKVPETRDAGKNQ